MPFLINIGSEAGLAPYPALLQPLQAGQLQHRAHRYIPTTSLSSSSCTWPGLANYILHYGFVEFPDIAYGWGGHCQRHVHPCLLEQAGGLYREWRTRIVLYKRKLELQKKDKEACINLMTSLTGVAWRQIEHLVDKAAEDKDGFDLILRHLDQTFKYDDQVEMLRAFERFFYGTSRREGQTLLNYVAEHREALAELEKHDIRLPDRVAVWVLLRRAGLSQEQRQLIQGHLLL